MRVLPVLLISFGLSGCIFGGKNAAKVTAPTAAPGPQPRGPEPQSAPSGPAPAPEAGVLAVSPPPLDQTQGLKGPDLTPITPTIPPSKPAVTPPPRRASRPRQTPQPTVPVTPAPDPAPTVPTPVPQLGEILTDAQRHQVETELADHLARARDVLTRATKAALNTGQVETRERIRIFIQQAEGARDRDPATALQLALRADLLAQDLLPALH
jgi:hypothetical protein